MLKNRIIPCLDVKNGRVVKGINFVELKDNNKKQNKIIMKVTTESNVKVKK